MAPEDVIDEGLLSDTREEDSFLRQHGKNLPPGGNTLRLVRDVGTEFDACVAELDQAVRESSAWTGAGKNARTQRIEKIEKGFAAVSAAKVLDFDLASLANELENTPALRVRVESLPPPEQPRRQERPGDDDFFDGFGIRG
ncbi:hypothetical protein [Saccharomonospora cyanea]|uniref:Terminase small subunit n=1 Tax=Saccharomonospora cyanea NA-134 TaxID=882082 RepID=H5XEX1_9PSEU|nr:hypothetical protein [Saccharomonospora cyanea]EHR60365.1 hypothetical protein SaccyDRAFT_1461 [Saccharomonospora cyanea NA-134]